MIDQDWGAKPLEQHAQGAWPQTARVLGKDQECKAVGCQPWFEAKVGWGDPWGFPGG